MHSQNEKRWHDVPDDIYREWAKIFYDSQEGLNLSVPCPVCKQKTLHCYYYPTRADEKIIEGRRYVARGDLWQWCSSCKSYVRCYAAVPDWWSCDLAIEPFQLTNTPETLEKVLRMRSS